MKPREKFDSLINSILHENYFGGSPYERKTRIKRHITFEDSGPGSNLPRDYDKRVKSINQQIEDFIGRNQPGKIYNLANALKDMIEGDDSVNTRYDYQGYNDNDLKSLYNDTFNAFDHEEFPEWKVSATSLDEPSATAEDEPADEEGELGRELKKELDKVEEYGYGDKSGNPEAQSQLDAVLEEFLDGLDVIKVGRHHGTIGGEMTVYSIPDDIKDDFRPYSLVAYSEKDLGDAAELFPLDKFYSVMMGTPAGERNGVPVLKNKFYDGPAKNLSDLSGKSDEDKPPPAGLDYDQIKRDVDAARVSGYLK